MSEIRRINLYGGPGCGKSTMMASVFSRMKRDNMNVEPIMEYIKFWTFIDRKPGGFDQIYTLAKQIHHEDTRLRNGVDLVISESPVLLSAFYAYHYNQPGWDNLLDYALVYEMAYPALHIFLDRTDLVYSEVGRYHEYEQAIEIDTAMKEFLGKWAGDYITVLSKDPDFVYFNVLDAL